MFQPKVYKIGAQICLLSYNRMFVNFWPRPKLTNITVRAAEQLVNPQEKYTNTPASQKSTNIPIAPANRQTKPHRSVGVWRSSCTPHTPSSKCSRSMIAVSVAALASSCDCCATERTASLACAACQLQSGIELRLAINVSLPRERVTALLRCHNYFHLPPPMTKHSGSMEIKK